MRIEPITRTADIAALLVASGLPVADLTESARPHLFGARIDGRLVGVVGIEVHGNVGLLRSLAVDAAFRKTGVGTALVAHVEDWAVQKGIADLYLLTTTAGGYFAQRGYEAIPRTAAPRAIARTAQFKALCPATATFMHKRKSPSRTGRAGCG